jgi:hypothetical protein
MNIILLLELLIESLGVEGLAQEGQLLEESGLPEREDLE